MRHEIMEIVFEEGQTKSFKDETGEMRGCETMGRSLLLHCGREMGRRRGAGRQY